MDAFVRAENIKTKITVSVLSDRQGNYRVENLGPGVYDVRATAIGYKSELRQNTKVDAGQPVSLDFDLQKGMVRWTDISIHQAAGLLPDGPGKKVLFTRCMHCHGLQNKIAGSRRDEEGWRNSVNSMR